jgi:hypothetical protein
MLLDGDVVEVDAVTLLVRASAVDDCRCTTGGICMLILTQLAYISERNGDS